ncbi:MAG: hypothetical protein JW720_06455 [Sedimentisphaerales bacterium]|nr:hypothetical protein [Sedimentisphaerales bacterium]
MTTGSAPERIASRSFPSVFQAWNPADNLKAVDPLVVAARHDLIWHSIGYFGLQWDDQPSGLATKFRPQTIPRAIKKRQALLRLNPNIILIAEIRYRDAHRSFLGQGHKWWLRDKQGRLVMGWAEGGYVCMDFHNPEFRRHVAARAAAVVRTGIVDGIILDWWADDDDRLELVKTVREAIGDEALILTNANDRITPRTAPYINGYFMECYRSSAPDDWKKIVETLKWAEKNLRPPRVNCLETWFHNSRLDLNFMRATTALSLTCSDGYCLFSDPNPLPTADHLHNWYPFWDKSLGKPLAKGAERQDGSFTRRFQNGDVIYNPMGNKPVSIRFHRPRTSLAAGKTASMHIIPPADGDIFLIPPATGSSP